MKKLIITGAVIMALTASPVMASECENLNISVCGDINCEYIEEIINSIKENNCYDIDFDNINIDNIDFDNINIDEVINNILSNIKPENTTTEGTTQTVTETTTQATNIPPVQIATEATTQASTVPPIQITTEATTQVTTEATTQASTEVTTHVTTEATTQASTEVTTQITTEATTQATTQTTTETTTEATTEASISKPNMSYAQQVLNLVNAEREKNGLSSLSLNSQLSNVAQIKSEDMNNNHYFSHNSPTYGSPFDMMKQFGISFKTAGENIAMGQTSPEQVVNGWLNSEGHRKNILNPDFKEMGLGYYKGNSTYWTQMFIG